MNVFPVLLRPDIIVKSPSSNVALVMGPKLLNSNFIDFKVTATLSIEYRNGRVFVSSAFYPISMIWTIQLGVLAIGQ